MATRLNDFSICIPTYNRAPLLRRCLSHLLNYTDRSFELIIGDNHSSDDTPRTIAALASGFKHLTVLRHTSNVGFSRNIDAILRRATRAYVYILSDDDFLFEGALSVVKQIMESRPQVAAVVGKYLSVDRLVEDAVVEYQDSIAFFVAAKNYDALLENPEICDGHPFMRRELFQRHCAYWDRTIGVLPLCMRLLEYGEVAIIDKPMFQHLTNADSLSTSMTEARMLDMFNADFEMAVSFPETRHLRGKLETTRQRFMQNLYLQAARMARNKGMMYLLWMFMKRLDSVRGAGDDLLVKAESAFMHEFIIDRIVQIARDAAFSSATHDASPECAAVAQALVDSSAQHALNLRFAPRQADAPNAANGLHLVADYGTQAAAGSTVALADLFGQLRLSPFGARLATFGGRLIIQYHDLQAAKLLELANPQFDLLCARYGDSP